MTLLTILLTALLVVLVVLLWLGRRVIEVVRVNTEETRALRVTARTRIAQANMRNGPVTEEQQLTRLGRNTRAKLIVVGGDSESELYSALKRGGPSDDD